MHELGNDRRVDDAFAVDEAAKRVQQHRRIEDALLQQVSETARVGLDESHRVRRLDVLGKDEDRRPGNTGLDLERGDQTLVCVRRRHPDVEHRHVRPMDAHRRQRLVAVARLGDDLASDLTKDGDDAGSREEGVIGDDYAHGRTSLQSLVVQDARAAGRAETVKDDLGGVREPVHEHAHRVSSPHDRNRRSRSCLDEPGHDGVDSRLRVSSGRRPPRSKVNVGDGLTVAA